MKPEREAGMFATWFKSFGWTHWSSELEHYMRRAYRAGAEAQRERDAQLVKPDDFTLGSSEWCALCAVQNAIRSAPIEGEKKQDGENI